MDSFRIYHNPACSKSRQTLALLRAHGIEPELRLYLQQPLDETEISQLIDALGGDVRQLLRDNEEEYKASKLDDPSLTQSALIAALAATPKLLQRPIVVCTKGAAIGRPPENILPLISRTLSSHGAV